MNGPRRGKRIRNLAGMTFGRLTVIGPAWRKNGRKAWLCRCACGGEKKVEAGNLFAGRTTSCGCLGAELLKRPRVHGNASRGAKTAEYKIWCGMIRRCENTADSGYRNYGGRGIRVCARWRESFAAFLADVGRRPSPRHSIDRFPDNDGNYEPGNCRWATSSEQRRNQRPRARWDLQSGATT